MAKALNKTKERKHNEKYTKLAELARTSMKLGKTTRKDICEALNIHLWELAELFLYDKELQREFTVIRRTLVDVAADNLQTILEDPNHPQNFQATKYVLQTYKSDLDTTLEAKDKDEVELSVSGQSGVNPIRITFGTKKLE